MGLSVKLADIAPCQKELKVEVPLDAVEAEFEAVYGELKKVARVPGFRVGAAPRDLLEQHHGDTAREQVLKRLVNRTLEEALSSHKGLDLIGRPEVTEVNFDPKKPLSYSARIEVAPKIPAGPYKKLKLTRPKMEVTEEQVAQVLSRLQEQQSQLKPVLESRAAEDGDYLLVDLTEQKQGASPVKRRDIVIQLNLQKDPEGFLRQLVGMTPGTERTIKLEKEKLLVAVSFKQLKLRELPKIDDAFAQTVGPFDTLEALKKSIRENVEQEAQRHQRRILEQAASERLLEGWLFDVPPSVVASQARRVLKDRAMDMMSQGVPASQVQEQAETLTEQAKLDALKQVKIFFILRQIAAAEALSATEEEVKARTQSLAAGMGVPVEQFERDLESRDLLDELVWGIVRSKVLDIIIREADIVEDSNKK